MALEQRVLAFGGVGSAGSTSCFASSARCQHGHKYTYSKHTAGCPTTDETAFGMKLQPLIGRHGNASALVFGGVDARLRIRVVPVIRQSDIREATQEFTIVELDPVTQCVIGKHFEFL